jgi:hypothetical protein
MFEANHDNANIFNSVYWWNNINKNIVYALFQHVMLKKKRLEKLVVILIFAAVVWICITLTEFMDQHKVR